MREFRTAIFVLLVCACSAVAGAQSPKVEKETVRGWLSDETCARGRASSGTYTGTNPRCAKECIAKGKKIVLIDPEKKRILAVENQSAARPNLGDYVEVTGTFTANTVHIASLKQVSKGVAACERAKLDQ